MKKLLIASAAIAAVITGCASNQAKPAQEEGHMMQGKHEGHGHGHHHGGKHEGRDGKGKRGDKKNLVANYTCSDNATIVAKYNPKDDNAVLTVNAPSWKLANQDITLNSAVSGSGMRFVNDTNPASLYEWQSNGRDGVLSVKVNGQEYSLTCTGKPADMPQGAPDKMPPPAPQQSQSTTSQS